MPLLFISCSSNSKHMEAGETEASTTSLPERMMLATGITQNLSRSPEVPRYNLERIGDTVDPFSKQPVSVPVGGDVTVSGWAVDRVNKSAARGVEVVVDGQPFSAHYGLDRGDVAEYYKVPTYSKSGFLFTIPASQFGKGQHVLSVRVVSKDGKTYYQGLELSIKIQ